jgi:hypothetical protein
MGTVIAILAFLAARTTCAAGHTALAVPAAFTDRLTIANSA